MQTRSGFVVKETHFTLISSIKGATQGVTLRFLHYDLSPSTLGRFYEPQHYHFEENKTYIVFAKMTDDSTVYRQLRTEPPDVQNPAFATTIQHFVDEPRSASLRPIPSGRVPTRLVTPISPQPGPATSFFNGLHRESNFLAIVNDCLNVTKSAGNSTRTCTPFDTRS